MKLTDARTTYKRCQQKGILAFSIRKHCWADHPNRGFVQSEILRLLIGKGHLIQNMYPSAKLGSFLWNCKDDDDENVEIVVIISETTIKAIAISAFRKNKK